MHSAVLDALNCRPGVNEKECKKAVSGCQGDVDVYRLCSDAYNLFNEKINAVKVVTLTNV